MTQGPSGPAPAPPPGPPTGPPTGPPWPPTRPPGAPPIWYPPPDPAGHQPGYPPPAGPNGLAIASLVIGVVGLAGCWIPFVGAALPVLALGLGVAGLGRARGTGPGRGPGIAGVVLGALGLLVAVTTTTLFLFLWPKISPCLDQRLSSDAQAQCLRDRFGLHRTEPPVPGSGNQISAVGRLGLLRPADRA